MKSVIIFINLRKVEFYLLIDKNKIQNYISLNDVAEFYSSKTKRCGSSTQILCPFHEDKNLGACYFRNGSRSFHCQGCGASGDMFTLASGYTGIAVSDFQTLLERLTRDFNIPLESVEKDRDGNGEWKREKVERLSEKEYARLCHSPYIQERGKDGKVNIVYLQTLATRDKEKHDTYVISKSRTKWLNETELYLKLKYSHIPQKEAQELMQIIKYFHLSEIAQETESEDKEIAALRNGDALEILKAIIQAEDELLKKAVSPEKYSTEKAARKMSFERRLSIYKSVRQST